MRSIIIITLAGILTGCTYYRPTGARFTAAEAIGIARQAAERDGIALRFFKTPSARYILVRNNMVWSVDFERKVSGPGSHFSIHVDDLTGSAKILHDL